MTNTNTEFITLGADVGGKDAFNAFNATNQHVLALRNLIRQECSIASGGLKEIALVLRIDGSVQAWGKCGVDNISLQKKKAFVAADIFVPVEVWSSGVASSIRQFLVDQVVCAVRLVVEDVNLKGLEFNGKPLEDALEKVRRQFLG